MSYISTLVEKFPIRRSKAQKAAFRAWFQEEAARLGYEAQVEEKGGHQNMIIGDPEKAQAIFTAHYDTPMHSLFPNNYQPIR